MNNGTGDNHNIGFRCLIAEDNIKAVEIMVTFLEQNGIAAATAKNGLEGLQLFLNNSLEYDMIFVDLQMPVMDGYEMTKQIRESGVSNSRTIPILAMSGIHTAVISEKCGFDYFLKKPFDMCRLTEIIQEVRQTNKIE
jgi:CheY-like chemotaxis protein